MRQNCERIRESMVWLADGERLQSGLELHLESCRECRAAIEEFLRMDRELKDWGVRLDRPSTAAAPVAARTQFPWIPAAAIALATAVGVILMVNYKQTAVTQLTLMHEPSKFRPIPYLAPLGPNENAQIVEMNLRVASLIAMGYRVAADPDQVVPAEVLVGEDGRAHAVRVLGDIDLNGPRD